MRSIVLHFTDVFGEICSKDKARNVHDASYLRAALQDHPFTAEHTTVLFAYMNNPGQNNT